MPKEFDDCVKSTYKSLVKSKTKPKTDPKTGKPRTLKDVAYAICTKQFMKEHGMSPAEYDKKHATSSAIKLLNFYKLINLVRRK